MTFLIKIFAVTLACTFVQGSDESYKQFFVQKSSESRYGALLAMLYKGTEQMAQELQCLLFLDEGKIKAVLDTAENSPVRAVSKEQLKTILGDCLITSLVLEENNKRASQRNAHARTEHGRRFHSQRTDSRADNMAAEAREVDITLPLDVCGRGSAGVFERVPGTVWCGTGTDAKKYEDLGWFDDVDRCCRDHDYCTDIICPGATRHNLTNNSGNTKLSCECDDDFAKCLQKVNSVTSNIVGNGYFDLVGNECFEEISPSSAPSNCLDNSSACKENAPKVYHFVPAKSYEQDSVWGK